MGLRSLLGHPSGVQSYPTSAFGWHAAWPAGVVRNSKLTVDPELASVQCFELRVGVKSFGLSGTSLEVVAFEQRFPERCVWTDSTVGITVAGRRTFLNVKREYPDVPAPTPAWV